MCYVFFGGQPTNCNLTAEYFFPAIPATKVLSKEVASGISVSYIFNNVLHSQSRCQLQTTNPNAAPVKVLPASNHNTLNFAGDA